MSRHAELDAMSLRCLQDMCEKGELSKTGGKAKLVKYLLDPASAPKGRKRKPAVEPSDEQLHSMNQRELCAVNNGVLVAYCSRQDGMDEIDDDASSRDCASHIVLQRSTIQAREAFDVSDERGSLRAALLEDDCQTTALQRFLQIGSETDGIEDAFVLETLFWASYCPSSENDAERLQSALRYIGNRNRPPFHAVTDLAQSFVATCRSIENPLHLARCIDELVETYSWFLSHCSLDADDVRRFLLGLCPECPGESISQSALRIQASMLQQSLDAAEPAMRTSILAASPALGAEQGGGDLDGLDVLDFSSRLPEAARPLGLAARRTDLAEPPPAQQDGVIFDSHNMSPHRAAAMLPLTALNISLVAALDAASPTEPVVIVVTAWLDSGLCAMMSSGHSPEAAPGGILRRVVGHAGRVSRPGPQLALDYGTKMGGCDVSDQRRAAHTTQKRTVKWFFPIFFWILDNAMTNSLLDYAILTEQPLTSVNVEAG